ncbi:MAG: sensor histidine kinase [Clostridia bacterium]|nr:sensor histidine kinase [Clostridia bacterium]
MDKRYSIIGQVKHSVGTMMILLILPVALSLLMMLIFFVQYESIIGNMNMAATLKEPVGTTIPEQLFSVAAGRLSFEESSVEGSIGAILETLNQLMQKTSGEGQLQLRVAGRTMETLEQYAYQVRDGMAEGIPILQIEGIVDEVRDVGELVNEMLDAFITIQINGATQTGARLRQMMLFAIVAEILVVLFSQIRTKRTITRVADAFNASILEFEGAVREIAGGNLMHRVPEMAEEEFRNLAKQINVMADQLETLIAQIRKEQTSLAKSELRALQAQINPHFLYNTLDTIIWQAESGNEEAVIRLTKTLSDFFRISLSAGADWIPVRQEIQHVAAYLSIQQTRYRDILTYSIDVPEQAENCMMVKFLLQPLVENALYHGIKAKRGGGAISITAECRDRKLHFAVRDQGKGMNEMQLSEVRRMLAAEPVTVMGAWDPKQTGFGLRNVDMRIRLYYQKPDGLTIESGPGGTCVSFEVPMMTMEELSNDERLSGR